MNNKNIRNFSIIAHIDHGKSTLADRILEFTHTISSRQMREQVLDKMELERERGITIKAKAVRLDYVAKDEQSYMLNLIDTPGHVDFTYEVSRSLAACEGTILLIDASQGIEAQTLANFDLAQNNNLKIIPVINKIDLPNADPLKVKKQIQDVLKFGEKEIILASAKEGIGIQEILETIVTKIPAPSGADQAPLSALIFDSTYNSYRGAIIYVRVIDGVIKAGMRILALSTGKTYEVNEVGFFRLDMIPADCLNSGEVGYIVAGIKNIQEVKIGDTICEVNRQTTFIFPGFKELKPMVFAGFYPVNPGDYELLQIAFEKLRLNDASFVYMAENSPALGFGFRCGFLGLLHMDIIKERLRREYNLDLVITSPNVNYQVKTKIGKILEIDNPVKLPSVSEIDQISEPFIRGIIITPSEFIGAVMQLAQDRRGIFKDMRYLDPTRVLLSYHLPLAEVILDFYDKLKSITRGYASFDYEHIGYFASDLVKLDILINQEEVDAFSFIVHRDKAYWRARQLAIRLRELIPRQLFEVPIQARIDNKIIARESVHALRKDVLAKCYGGDITRKRKLLEKQREGKKRMKQIGQVAIPPEAFLAVLKLEEE